MVTQGPLPPVVDNAKLERVCGHGAMAVLIRSHAWEQTVLGPIAGWPVELLTMVNFMLASPLPMQIFWGAEMTLLYNDALLPFLAGKHPQALGQPGKVAWKEAWPAVGAQLESVLYEGKQVSFHSVLLPILRNGVLENFYWNYSYSPIYAPGGEIAGILNIAQDITQAVVGQHELRAAEARDLAARHSAAQAQDRLTERLSQVLDATTDAIVSVDRNWVMTYLNPMAEKLYGSKEQLVGQRVWDAFPDAKYDGSPFVEHYYRAMDKGIAGSFETHYPEPLNFWLRLEVFPTRDGIVTFSRDISEGKRAAELLREKDERLRLALTAARTVGTWDWDAKNNRVYVDEEFARFYQVDPKRAAQGLPPEDFIKDVHPEDAAQLGAAIASAMETGEDYKQEYRLVQADGSVRWVSSAGRCKLAADGAAVRFSGVTVDITEVRQADEALRRSEENLRIAATTARLGTWDLDLISGRMECSAICKANFGWPLEKRFDYQDLLVVIHPEDRAGMQAAAAKAIATATDYRIEYRVFWPDASLHWVLASGRTVVTENGKPTRMAGVTMDVTERHRAQAALLQGEKLAAVGRLAASIAHEINNPLESVTNLLYLARHTADLSLPAQEYLDLAERELRRVSIISNQTLRFYKQSTSPRPVTCEDLFGSALSIFQGRLVNSQVQVEKRKRATHPVLCFENEIRQVLNNLVGNAIDAMHPAGGRLLLRSRDATDPATGAPGLMLTVADTGSGISPDVLKHIFEAFFTTKGIGGTGLGLWVSYEIIERHRGRFRVRSSQKAGQHGTVFTVFLPTAAVSRGAASVS